MQLNEVLYACECITGISAIPIRVYTDKTRERSYGLENMPVDPVSPFEDVLLEREGSISYLYTAFYQFYGIVKNKQFTLILGPIGQPEYTWQEKRDYAFTLGLSPIDFDRLLMAMRQIPAFSPENFLHLLLLLNFYFNGQRRDIGEITAELQIGDESMLYSPQKKSEDELPQDVKHESPPHNTRSYEKEMLNFVREGDVSGLKSYLNSRIHGSVGSLSNEHLRHQKNLFIVAATLVSRAAMDGGLYEDEAYSLSDMYIRRCEDFFSTGAILQLNYEMVLDFTQRVFSIDRQTVLSPLVSSAVTYIRQNISADLSCSALAAYFFVNRNHLSAKFKEDTGRTPGEFVTHERIRRAKNLLVGTDKPLAEIASYLGFSSQSYFQTVFKQQTGKTPHVYRSSEYFAATEKPRGCADISLI